jgi:hypothetical protein
MLPNRSLDTGLHLVSVTALVRVQKLLFLPQDGMLFKRCSSNASESIEEPVRNTKNRL